MKRKPAQKVQRHPATEQRFRDAAQRWNTLSTQHREIVNQLWAGTMARHFDADEIEMLRQAGFLCPRDESYLLLMAKAVKR